MKKQIIVINGGNAFKKFEEYLDYLKNRPVDLERLRRKDWKSNLNNNLGIEYEVLIPQMPNSQNARYSEWKIWFERVIPLLNEKVIFIGHSLGGIFLAKYLSENNYPKTIEAIFLVAAPYNTQNQYPIVDFVIQENLDNLSKQVGKIFLYQSKDDEVVPYSNVESYKKTLPNAIVKIFEDRKHFNQENFPEIVDDIKKLNSL
jgi:predicted alpha/beta hydrolase family esterase